MEPSGLLSQPVRLAGASLLRLQSDERLVELVRAGHEPAFDTIVHRYRPALLRYGTRILGPERAEDAVQQALASAHTAMTSGDERHLHLRPWLYRIVHNAALNVLRGRREEVELSDTEFAAAHTPEEQVAERERLEAVLAAIAALPQSQRDALLLRELEGRSHEEIGRALGVSPGAARATLFRARAAVRSACTALTPTPLLLRAAEIGGADASSHVAAKAVAGVLAGCAIVGGGASTGVIGGTHHPAAPAAKAPERAVRPPRTTKTTTPAPVVASAVAAAPANGSSKAREPKARLRTLEPPRPVKVKRRPERTPPQAAAAPHAVGHHESDASVHPKPEHVWRSEGSHGPQIATRPGRGRGAERGGGRGGGREDASEHAPPADVWYAGRHRGGESATRGRDEAQGHHADGVGPSHGPQE